MRNIFKKVCIFLGTLMIFISTNSLEASPLPVTSANVQDVVQDSNRYLEKSKINYHMNLLDITGNTTPYIIYIATLGEENKGVSVIMFFVNKTDAIEKITIGNNPHDKVSQQYTYEAIRALSSALGLSNHEIKELTNGDMTNTHSVWCDKTNRRIILSLKIIEQGPYFKISADDK